MIIVVGTQQNEGFELGEVLTVDDAILLVDELRSNHKNLHISVQDGHGFSVPVDSNGSWRASVRAKQLLEAQEIQKERKELLSFWYVDSSGERKKLAMIYHLSDPTSSLPNGWITLHKLGEFEEPDILDNQVSGPATVQWQDNKWCSFIVGKNYFIDDHWSGKEHHISFEDTYETKYFTEAVFVTSLHCLLECFWDDFYGRKSCLNLPTETRERICNLKPATDLQNEILTVANKFYDFRVVNWRLYQDALGRVWRFVRDGKKD